MDGDRFEVRALGTVESPLRDLADAPKQGDEGAPAAWLAFEPEAEAALEGLAVGHRVVVVTWLDRGDRSVLQVHPRDDLERPLTGVFATRSPDRPNPIGLHAAEIVELEGRRLRVAGLEAIDGTPILDIKPALSAEIDRR